MGHNTFYRVLLRAYPRDFRATYGKEMEAAYAACAERERRRRFAAVRIPLRAILDTMRHATEVRLDERRLRRHSSCPPLSRGHGAHTPKGAFVSYTIQDLRFALRVLLKDRGFTTTVLLTLALCIAANAAIFAVVESVLLRPLPVPEPGRLVTIVKAYPKAGVERAVNSVPDYYDRLESMQTVEGLALYRRAGAAVGAEGGAERMISAQVTPSFFRVLQTPPSVGRPFPGEDTTSPLAEVVISDLLWRTRFAARPDIIGQRMRIDGVDRSIVGVMPADFRFEWPDIAFWTPLTFGPTERVELRRHSNGYQMIARLKPGASLQQAQQELDAIDRRNHDRVPQLTRFLTDSGFQTRALFYHEDSVRGIRPVLALLWGGVALLLLIGAVNVTNLVMVRSSARQREMAARHAIGAGTARLARQLVTESLLLTLAGAVLGLLLGRWALELAPLAGLDEIPGGQPLTIRPATVGLVLGLSVVIGLFVSAVPVARLWRMDLTAALREQGRSGTASPRAMLARRILATAQVALAFLLLAGAALLVASFQRVLAVDPGFTPEGAVAGHITLPSARYPDGAAVRSFVERALERLRATPGLSAVAMTDSLPLGGNYSDVVILAEGRTPVPGESLLSPLVSSVTDGYFQVMDIALVSGRTFDARDTSTSPKVAIVDRKLAQTFWPGQDPVGRRLFSPGGSKDFTKPGPTSVFYTVVGVVDDVAVVGLAEEASRVGAYYFPLSQRPSSSLAVVTRSALAPGPTSQAMRAALAEIDPELPLFGVMPMDERLGRSLGSRRTPLLLAATFAVIALLLSAIGIYGVLAYQVAQRRREIGIRMALGSTVRGAFALVVRDGAGIVAMGLALGLLGTLLMRDAIESLLFGVGPLDPTILGAVGVLLAGVSMAAVAVPANRAARVDPSIALTNE